MNLQAEWQELPLTRRKDNSYEIMHNGYPFHVPCEEPYEALWEEVEAFARAHPDKVSEEREPVPPTPVQTNAVRRAEIMERLHAIDSASMRAVRVHAAGRATAEDAAVLVRLEEQAARLREELAALS